MFTRKILRKIAMAVLKIEVQYLHLYRYSYMPKKYENIVSSLNTKDVVIDLGASIGDSIAGFNKRRPKIIAFEPNPYVFHFLKKRFGKKENIFLVPAGAWIKGDVLPLKLDINHLKDEIICSEACSLYTLPGRTAEEEIKVPFVDLKPFILSHDKIKILKMNIEGAEYEILGDIIKNNLEGRIEYIWVQRHDHLSKELAKKGEKLDSEIKKKKVTNIDFGW